MKHNHSSAPLYFVLDELSEGRNAKLLSIVSVGLGALLLSLLAQVTIYLPWTPVPITGQTFAVTLIALLYGRKHALASVLLYLGLGGIGLPVFAMGKAGLGWGPTLGYLAGMALSAYVVGGLADRNFLKTWPKALIAGFAGSFCVFTCGLLVLSQFMPSSGLIAAGLIPFLPGDLVKTVLAISIARAVNRKTSAP